MAIAAELRRLVGPIQLIHAQAGPRLLRLTRAGIFLLWTGKLLLDPLWRLADLPRDMFQPIGILTLFPTGVLDQLLTPVGLTLLLAASILSALAALTNRAFPITSTIAAILLTIYSCVIRGFGPPVHTDIVLLLSTYALAAYAWADFFHSGSDARKAAAWSSFPLITIVIFLCTSYMLVGINRILAGGLEVFTGDTMEFWAIDASLRAYYFDTGIGWHIPQWPLTLFMLRLGLPIITLFEIAAPLCLASARFRTIFIPVMLSFHALSLVFMNIFFFDDMLLYLLLVDWSRGFPSLRRAD